MRPAVVRHKQLDPWVEGVSRLKAGETIEHVMLRFRSLGCTPCTGAIASEADTLEKIVHEIFGFKVSERSGRIISYDSDGSMESRFWLRHIPDSQPGGENRLQQSTRRNKYFLNNVRKGNTTSNED